MIPPIYFEHLCYYYVTTHTQVTIIRIFAYFELSNHYIQYQ